MADSIVVLRQRACRAEGCGALFFICRSCDRGQSYCSQPCRRLQRRQQCRAANRDTSDLPRAELIIATAKEPTVSASSKPA